MSREKTLFIIALLVMAVPHLGLTNLLEDVVLFALGLVILVISYGMYLSKKKSVVKKPIPRKKITTPSETFMPPLVKKGTVEGETGFKVIKRGAVVSPHEESNTTPS
jgi:hypothetical protein